MMEKPDIFYITTPIYYVNDKPHIGHVYTTLAADVLARWHRLRGGDVFFLTGTDEHGAKVAASAAANRKTPQQFADENSERFRDAFKKLGIVGTDFIRTTELRHVKAVRAFMEKLQNATTPKGNPALYEADYRGLYCIACERFYTEKELADGRCPIHKRPVEPVKERNVFFRLSDYLDDVRNAVESDAVRVLPEERKREALGLIEQGIEDFSVSREKVKWGIPFPGKEGQTIYVWVEALQNYLSALGYPDAKPFQKFWPASVQLIGKDILKFHAIYWPALLMAAGLPLPKTLFVHGFFTINGDKMSKSQGNVIDPVALTKEYGIDGVRYLLLTQFPFGQDGDVQQGRFRDKYNTDLANGIGNFASRVLAMVHKYSGGEVPVAEGISPDVQTKIDETRVTVHDALDAFAFERALAAIQALITDGDTRIDRAKPWQLATSSPEQLPQILYDLLAVLVAITVLLAPFLPETTAKLRTTLGLGEAGGDDIPTLPPGRSLAPIEPLFPRLAKQ
ncbi:MAG: methionine--tRNA ligase [Candidatus Kerfeldbacteria bacterium]|nr:methionine--tRNA ligase [Candidatus Kerfeldbacteria bacterium]